MKKKVIISILTMFICIPLFMDTPLAEPKNVYNTPYGTYTTDYTLINSNQYGEINIGPFVIYAVDKNVSTFKYQFNNYYTGTVTINTFTNINPTDSLASYKPEMFTDNCTILSYTDSSVTFYIKNVKEFSATLVYPTGNSQFNIQAWANPGTTNITVSQDVQTSVNQILSYVQFINEDSFSIAADIGTIKNKLLDVLGYSSSDDTIETDFDTLISAVNSVGTKLDLLHTDITTLINVANSIYNNNLFGDLPDYSLSSIMLMKSYGYALNYDSDINYPYFQATNVAISQNVGTFYMDSGTEISFIFATTPYSFNTTSIASWYSTMNRTNFSYQLLNQLGRYYIYKVNFKNNGNGYDYVGIKFNQNYRVYPIYLGLPQNIPVNVNALSRIFIDDRYTSKLQGIIDAVNNMSLNVNQLTVNATGITYNVNNTQVNNSVTTYNTDIQNVYNVENDFSTTFNTYNQQFTPDFTETMTTIQNVPSVMNNIVVDLYNLPFIKYPLLITLAGIVLIALLGV